MSAVTRVVYQRLPVPEPRQRIWKERKECRQHTPRIIHKAPLHDRTIPIMCWTPRSVADANERHPLMVKSILGRHVRCISHVDHSFMFVLMEVYTSRFPIGQTRSSHCCVFCACCWANCARKVVTSVCSVVIWFSCSFSMRAMRASTSRTYCQTSIPWLPMSSRVLAPLLAPWLDMLPGCEEVPGAGTCCCNMLGPLAFPPCEPCFGIMLGVRPGRAGR